MLGVLGDLLEMPAIKIRNTPYTLAAGLVSSCFWGVSPARVDRMECERARVSFSLNGLSDWELNYPVTTPTFQSV